MAAISAKKWYEDLLEYEATHEIAFASPSALAEARVIAKLEDLRKRHRRKKKVSISKKRV
jgi:hypothetical protein